jgi:hypothetical protein
MNPSEPTLPLFPQDSSSPSAELPQDIQQALRVISGDATDADLESLLGGKDQSPPSTPDARQQWEGGLLKKHESEKAKPEFFDHEFHCLDLTNEDDQVKAAEIFNRVAAQGSRYQIEQTPVKIMGDSKAPKGFRAITVIKVWKVKLVLPPGTVKPEFMHSDATSPSSSLK